VSKPPGTGIGHCSLEPGYIPHKLQRRESISYNLHRGTFPTSKPHNDTHFVDQSHSSRGKF